DPRRVVSAEGFDVRDPFEIIDSPVDPNGALADIAINLAFNYGSVAAGQSVSSRMVMTFGRTVAEAEATYQSNTAGTSVRDHDFYRVTVEANRLLEVEAEVPAHNGGEFVNLLDPMVRLYRADGTLVAQDDNSGSNGNASLSYRVPQGAGGTYYIEVLPPTAPATPPKGEDLLNVKHAGAETPAFQ